MWRRNGVIWSFISLTCSDIRSHALYYTELVKEPKEELALRLSGHLLLGLSRIFSKKVGYFLNDCSDALVKIKMAFRNDSVDLNEAESTARVDTITMAEEVENTDVINDDMMLPIISGPDSVGLNLDITVDASDIMLEGDYSAMDDDLVGDNDNILLPPLENDDVGIESFALSGDNLRSQEMSTPLPEVETLRRSDQNTDDLLTPTDGMSPALIRTRPFFSPIATFTTITAGKRISLLLTSIVPIVATP